MATASHVKLNRGAAAGLTRATDHLPALTRAYARALRAGGRRAAARFRQVEAVTAAAQPQTPAWIPPETATLIDQGQLAVDVNKKTGKIHRLILTASATEALQPFGINFDIHAPTSQAILSSYADRITATVGDAIAEQVTEAIQTGYASGQSVAQVSSAIQTATNAISPVRADMLARSDLNGISNAGSLLAAQTSGAAKTKSWLAVIDDRTRPDHVEADGQTVALGAQFTVGGESCSAPGDPNLSWEQSANCFPAGTLVRSSAFTLCFRRWYSGDLVTVETDGDHRLSGTPNHPVLTTSGWKPLAALDRGDYLVCSSLCQEEASANPDVEHAPSKIEEVFAALAEVGFSRRIRGTDVDFHGEVLDGEVDVVGANGLLGDISDTPSIEPFSEHDFASAYETQRSFLAERPLAEVCVGPLHASDGVMRSGTQAPPFFIGGQSHPRVHRLGSVARLNAELEQTMAYSSSRDFVELGESLLGFPCEVAISQVVKRDVVPFAGHVFNLQAGEGQVYSANGVIVHNCRCTVTYGNPLTASAHYERLPDIGDLLTRAFLAKGDQEFLSAMRASPTPGVLYLARHGLTEYDSDDHATDTIRAWSDDPLNEKGVAEARRLADNLGGHAIGSISASDLQRAAKTGDIIADALGLVSQPSDTLRPWNLGDLTGRTSDDARDDIEAYCDNPDEQVPGGESFNDFCSRFLPALAGAMSAAEAGGSPLLVTHSHNIKLARAWIASGRQPVSGDEFCQPSPGPASVLAVDPADGWSVTEIMCDGNPTDPAEGSVPPSAHYRPAADPERACAVCDFMQDDGSCSRFAGDPQVLADYTCDEFVAKSSANAVTSGGNMTSIDVERLTSSEREALRALLDAPLTPEQARLSAARDALAAKGVGSVYDDEEITALFAIIDSRAETAALELSDFELTAAATGGTQWQAVLCVAGEPTVDSGVKRLLDQDGGSWLPLPRPLALLDDSPHADMTTKSPICGRIDQIWWAGNVCQASGVFFDDSADQRLAEAGSKAAALVSELRGQLGVSVDLVDIEAELMVWNGSNVVSMDEANDPTASNYDDKPGGPATEANLPNDIPEMEEEEWVEPDYVMCFTRWVIAAATIVPVQALTNARISIVAGGFEERYRWFTRSKFEAAALTASAAGLAPAKPPREWFDVPEADDPTPLTVTDDGRVYGHMALWNSCHTGFSDRCVPPPKSPSDYTGFHLGEIPTAEGERVKVGTLTMDTGHAGLRLSAERAVAHYDNTGTAAAYVRASDGKHGIWVAGTLSARLAAEDAQALMAAKPSGDWREIFRGKGRDMLAALMVNVPGFVVPRTLTASGLPYGDETVEFSCEPCDEALARELAVLAASADGIEGLASLVA